MYHTSALHAMAIESVMRPCILGHDPLTLFNLSSLLRPYTTSMATLYSASPLPLVKEASIRQIIQDSEPTKRCGSGWNMMSLMHHGRLLGHKRLTQMVVTRGLTSKHLEDLVGKQENVPLRDASIDGLFSGYWHTPATICYNVRRRFPTLAPFPKIFQKSIQRLGDTDECKLSELRPMEVPTLTALATSTDISVPLRDLVNRMTLYQNSTTMTGRHLSEEDAEETQHALGQLTDVIHEFEEIKQMAGDGL